MILTNCNCGEKVECGCGTLSFDTYNASATSVLEVGNLVADGECTLDEYVIDWYRDGVHALVTGKGLDPDIQAFHPMTGNSAVPVIGGTWIPVLRYFVIDGVQLFPEPKPCRKWCDITVDLPTITVARLNCGSTNITGAYQYRISYSSTDPNALPSRIVAWDLPSDQSIINFAIRFYAYNVADKIEVFFNNDLTPLASWITGYDTSTDFSSNPPRFRPVTVGSPLHFVVALPAYTTGDFLKIKITPSVLTPLITQTDWIADFKCLNASTVFNCDFLTLSRKAYDVTTYAWTDNTAMCQWELSMNLVNPFPNFSNSLNPYYPFSLYTGMNAGTFNMAINLVLTNSPQKIGLRFPYSKTALAESYNAPSATTRYASVANINLVKTGNVFVWTFTSQDDYDDVYSRYQTAIASKLYTNYVNDPLNVYYYRFWQWRWKSRPINCGDNALSTDRALYFHLSSTVIFDYANKTVTITSASITNQYSSETCNSLVTSINTNINLVNATINAANYNENSLCFEWRMFGSIGGFTGSIYSFGKDRAGGWTVHVRGDNNPCTSSFEGICKTSSAWYYFLYYLRCIIDLDIDPLTGDFPRDEFGDYIDHPWENFSVYENINPTTYCQTNTTTDLVLRVENGVLTYPV